ncbi:MAG: MarR family transcriptional regulator [Propionibacteriales bacterium]|nr:MarR family transcriptional regulator [Propionibacteriales bacterium]
MFRGKGIQHSHDCRELALSDQLPTAHTLDLEQQLCYGLSIAARGVVAAYKPLLEPLGLTHPQYLVMVSLWQHGPLSVKDLGALLALDSGTLSPLVKRLETMGLVRRRRTFTDERQVTISVTERGEEMTKAAEKVHETVVERLGLDPEELDQLHGVINRVIEATIGTLRPPNASGLQPGPPR